MRHTRIGTALGQITLVADGDQLTGLYFPHHWYRPSEESFGRLVEVDEDGLFRETRDQLEAYLEGRRHGFDLPTRLRGDPFQERVWALIDQIPYGTTVTYAELAERLGDRGLAQQVGQAVGRNPLAVIVPCHRVVGVGGRLTGYAGGLRRKAQLLTLEEPVPVVAGKLF